MSIIFAQDMLLTMALLNIPHLQYFGHTVCPWSLCQHPQAFSTGDKAQEMKQYSTENQALMFAEICVASLWRNGLSEELTSLLCWLIENNPVHLVQSLGSIAST